MKVKDLIVKLKELPKEYREANVVYFGEYGSTGFSVVKKEKKVWPDKSISRKVHLI